MMKKAGGVFIVNDHADIAKAVDADGVHLGQDDLPLEEGRRVMGPHKFIGISTHNIEQARAAEAGGADYIGFGPLFSTLTKDAGPERGLEMLRSIRNTVTVPILVIGGIKPANAAEAIHAGADGVAVISAVLSSSEPHRVIRTMIDNIGAVTSSTKR